MPRHPAAELTVVPQLPGTRPEPPADLTAREQQLWRDIVGSMPPNWFLLCVQPLLRQLIVHIINAEKLTAVARHVWQITADIYFVERFDCQLQGQLIAESKIIAELAHKLRLTPSARSTLRAADFARRSTPQTRPWED